MEIGGAKGVKKIALGLGLFLALAPASIIADTRDQAGEIQALTETKATQVADRTCREYTGMPANYISFNKNDPKQTLEVGCFDSTQKKEYSIPPPKIIGIECSSSGLDSRSPNNIEGDEAQYLGEIRFCDHPNSTMELTQINFTNQANEWLKTMPV